jgi:hypothetical protein
MMFGIGKNQAFFQGEMDKVRLLIIAAYNINIIAI